MVDKNELSKLCEEARKENEKNEQAITDYIKTKTDKTLRVESSIHYPEDPMDIKVDVEFIKENGKSDFGSDFFIYYRPLHYGEAPKLAMSCGTIGSYTKEEEPFQIDRMRLMVNLWDSEAELVGLFNSLSRDTNKAAEKLMRQSEKEEAESRKQKAIDSIKVGYSFSRKDGKYDIDYTITKITPKRVYLEYTENYETSHCVWNNDNVAAGEQKVLRHVKKSGYIDYDILVKVLSTDSRMLDIYNYIKGSNTISCASENLEFIPYSK